MNPKNSSTFTQLIVYLIFVLQTSLSAKVLAGTDAGNGGDFEEMQFISLGYEALDLMTELKKEKLLPSDINLTKWAEVLKSIDVEFVPEVKLNGRSRSAANYPAKNYIPVDEKQWAKKQFDPIALFQMVMHELMPVIGIDDTRYIRSAPLIMMLKKRNAFDRLSVGHTRFAESPVLIHSEYQDPTREGLGWTTVTSICDSVKQEYNQTYFFVYCEYISKSWFEYQQIVVPQVERNYFYSSWSEFRRLYSAHGYSEQSSYSKTWIPQTVERNFTAYGLRVYGWANLSIAPWKVIADSHKDLELDFTTDRLALRECRERILRHKFESDYYRAKCESNSLENGKFGYVIRTQNPMVKSR